MRKLMGSLALLMALGCGLAQAKNTKRIIKLQFKGVVFDTGIPFVGDVKDPILYLKVYADSKTNKVSHLKFSILLGNNPIALPAKWVFTKKVDMDRMKMLATLGTNKADEGIFYLNKNSQQRKFLAFRFKVNKDSVSFCNLKNSSQICSNKSTKTQLVKLYARNQGEKGWVVDSVSIDGRKHGLYDFDQKYL